jgi:hypothetical protein
MIELRSWLKTPPPGLLRLKGFVQTSSPGQETKWHEIQLAGRCNSVSQVIAPIAGAALVAIGLCGHLPRARLSEFFERISV